MIAFKRVEVIDPGIEEGIKKLTPDKIEQTISFVIDKETAARFKAYMETCIHCGLCAEACHFYLSYDKDPTYAPVGKVRQTLWEMIKHKGKVSPEFIKKCARIAYTECNLCRRCHLFCPFGIEIAYQMATVRRICHLLQVVPRYIQDTVNSHAVTMNQMWVKQEDWIDTLQWKEEEMRAEYPKMRIPIDKEGADFMYSPIAPEPKFAAHLLQNFAIIANSAGVDWTMPSRDGWDNSNMAMFTGDFETMGRVERAFYEAAFKLKVKRIVMCECGHAFRAGAVEGPRWLNWPEPPIPHLHAIEFYYEILKSGKLKLKGKFREPVTVQHPCNVIRNYGLEHKLRWVLNEVCETVIDPVPTDRYNYCCAAGGGVINCGPIWTKERVRGNRVKAEQLKAAGTHFIVTPCHNCHSGIEHIIKEYKLGMHTLYLNEILIKIMEIPEAIM